MGTSGVVATVLGAATLLLVTGAEAGTDAPVTVVTTHNRVFATGDARHWGSITPRGLLVAVDDVDFLDARHGWAVSTDCSAAEGRLFRTSDGGKTWSRRRFSSHSCAAGARTELEFVSTRVGFAATAEPTGPGEALEMTHDGGRTWAHVNRELPSVGPVSFRTSRAGWLGGIHLYRSQNGGRSWRRVVLAVPKGAENPELPDQFGAPTFHGERAFVAASFLRGKKLVVWVYSTTDSGDHWRVTACFSQRWRRYWPALATSAPSTDAMWIATPTPKPLLYVTADGGRRWARHPLPFRIAKLEALDARIAVAQTFLRRIRVTFDGGATWRRPSLP